MDQLSRALALLSDSTFRIGYATYRFMTTEEVRAVRQGQVVLAIAETPREHLREESNKFNEDGSDYED